MSAPGAQLEGRRRRPSLLAVLALAMVCVGVAGVVVSSGLEGRRAEVVGGNVPVNPEATSRLDVSAQNSPALVANPRDPANMVVASRVDAPRFSCALHVSFDGGASWRATPLPIPPSDVVGCFGPDASFGADGTLYVAYTSFADVAQLGKVPDAVWLLTSRDGGRSVSAPARAHGPLAFHLRVAAHPSVPGRVFMTWLQAADSVAFGLATPGRPIVVSRSDDSGGTWSSPVTVTPAPRQRVVAPTLTVAGDGVYLAYLDVGEDRLDYHGAHEGRGGDPYEGPWSLVFARSPDGGETWAETVVDPRVVPGRRFLMLFPPAPAVALDIGRNRAYVAFHDARLGDEDVWAWASGDGGRSFGPARRVNDTRSRDGTAQYLAALDVAEDGRLDAVYFDRRADPKNVRNEVSFQSSHDQGRTFGPRLRVSDRSFDSTIGFGASRGMADLGSRLGLVSTPTAALAVWADTRAEERETGEQDLARALVAVSDADPLKEPLRIGGFAVAALGGVVLVAGFAGRARRAP